MPGKVRLERVQGAGDRDILAGSKGMDQTSREGATGRSPPPLPSLVVFPVCLGVRSDYRRYPVPYACLLVVVAVQETLLPPLGCLRALASVPLLPEVARLTGTTAHQGTTIPGQQPLPGRQLAGRPGEGLQEKGASLSPGTEPFPKNSWNVSAPVNMLR